MPICLNKSRVNIGKKLGNSQIVAVSSNLLNNCVVIGKQFIILILIKIFYLGFKDSTVFYYYGDYIKDKSPKYKSLREGASILGVGFLTGLVVAQSSKNQIIGIFVITNNSLHSYILNSGVLVKTVIILIVCW